MKSAKRNDRPRPGHPLPDTIQWSHALGTWVNTFAETGELARVRLFVSNGDLMIQAFGAGESGESPTDWGVVPVTPHVANLHSATLAGFEADYDLGFVRVRFAANLKLGILVIQSYNRFLDHSDRPAYYRREFFYRVETEEPESADADSETGLSRSEFVAGVRPRVAADSSGDARTVDLSRLLGTWNNSNEATEWIRQLTIAREEAGYTLTVRGIGDDVWGTCPLQAFEDNIGELAFHATVQHDSIESLLAANTNKGLIVVAAFHRFVDDRPETNFLCREFFYCEPEE